MRLASVTKKAEEAFDKMHAEDKERFDKSAIEEVPEVTTASKDVVRMESALKEAENTLKDLIEMDNKGTAGERPVHPREIREASNKVRIAKWDVAVAH